MAPQYQLFNIFFNKTFSNESQIWHLCSFIASLLLILQLLASTALKNSIIYCQEWDNVRIRTQVGIYGKLRTEPSGLPSDCALGQSLGLRPYFTVYPSSRPNTDTKCPPVFHGHRGPFRLHLTNMIINKDFFVENVLEFVSILNNVYSLTADIGWFN